MVRLEARGRAVDNDINGLLVIPKGAEQMLTEEQIIAIKKEAIADDPGKPWGDSIAFARLIESVIRAEYEYVPNKTIVNNKGIK